MRGTGVVVLTGGRFFAALRMTERGARNEKEGVRSDMVVHDYVPVTLSPLPVTLSEVEGSG